MRTALIVILFIVLVGTGAGYFFIRYQRVQAYYDVVSRLGYDLLDKGELEEARVIVSLLSNAKMHRKAQQLINAIEEFEKSVSEVERRIKPYIADGDYETALSIVNSSDFADNAKRYLRELVYSAWGWIVVSANLTGSHELYAVRPDGSQAYQMTFNTFEESTPSVSPSGKHIAFARPTQDSSGRAIVVMNTETGEERQLEVTGTHNVDPCFMPDGDGLLFSSLVGSFSVIYLARLSSPEVMRLVRGPVANAPAVSPDGRLILFEGFPKLDEGAPPPLNVSIQVMAMGSDGSDVRSLTNFERGHCRNPAVSPDNVSFAFRRDDDIYIGGFDGREPRVVSDPALDEKQPKFSPDGRHLLYIASKDGKNIMVRQDIRTGDRMFYQPMGTSCQQPVWVKHLTLPPRAKLIELPRIDR